MKIQRTFTTAGADPFDSVTWAKRTSRIVNPDGSVVFEMTDAEVPAGWSQLATDIMVSKYFRKAGVPLNSIDGGTGVSPVIGEAFGEKTGETPVPPASAFPKGSVGKTGETPVPPEAAVPPVSAVPPESRVPPLTPSPSPGGRGGPETGPEKSAQQVIHRLAGCWRHWGEMHGYFDTPADAQAFEDEITYMLVHQMAAPNSPQWFNTGLNWAYEISGPAQGHFIADPQTGAVRLADDAYTHPQPHACFIQSVTDDLVNPGGIMDLWVREARLFKYGSGTGTNFSSLRAENERLSGGGKSSGLMSWLKIGDRAAGAIKSGGTTRRAAKMVCLDLDHPDIEQFINWKVREEIKVAAMVEGLTALPDEQRETAERLGLRLDYDFNGEAYQTVSGQNSNNSVRINDAFFKALDADAEWPLTSRVTGEVHRTVPARDLWEQIAYAAWCCADPGVQYDTTINAWHTCPASGRINASNPCSEYMFLDNTACNLASINLMKFYDQDTRAFDVEAFEHAVDLWTIVLEISVLMAAFPSEEIARLSWEYRTLGLGYANLGAVLMRAGIPYDSPEARAFAGAVTAVLTGRSYRQSALLASELGPFAGFEKNREPMLRVIRNHRRAARGVARQATGADAYEDLSIAPVPIDHAVARSAGMKIANAGRVLDRAVAAWDSAVELGERHGYRNAQVTVIAPTGTIGLLMDCDTTGVEPDFALVKFKKLAGGGYFKIANASLRPALEALGYSDDEVRAILTFVLGTLKLDAPIPGLRETLADFLRSKGLTDEDLARVEEALPSVFELGFALNAWTIGEEAFRRLGIDPADAKADPDFNLLRSLGLTREQIDALSETICGAQTIEGAPGLHAEHLPVFDCASTCGARGRRFIAVEGHIRMMAAAQPFISGAISKTINLPHSATLEDIKSAYRLSWELGLKANALYRDGSKLSQPLSSKSDGETDAGRGGEAGRGLDEPEVRLLTEQAVEAEQRLADLNAQVARAEARLAELEASRAAGVIGAKAADVRIVRQPMRRRLPDTRQSITHKFSVAGHEGYMTVGLYDDDGRPGELFITMAKEGSTIGGIMDSLGTAVSVALQYGVPVESLVNKFTHQRFEPSGMTSNREIPIAKSLVDYIFRWLGIQFVKGYREANVPRRPSAGDDAGETDRTISPRANGNGAGLDEAPRLADEPVIIEETVHDERIHESRRRISAPGGRLEAVLSDAMRDCQGDAPACEECGTITVRNGTCYRCLNCGHSMGCS